MGHVEVWHQNHVTLIIHQGKKVLKSKSTSCCCLVTKSYPTLLQSRGLQPAGLLCPWDFPGKSTGVGCHFLHQGIFLTQGWNPRLLCFLHWQADALPLSPQGFPKIYGSSPNVHKRHIAHGKNQFDHFLGGLDLGKKEKEKNENKDPKRTKYLQTKGCTCSTLLFFHKHAHRDLMTYVFL